METIDLQPFHWEHKDVDGRLQILCWGLDKDSVAHLIRIENFPTFCWIELPRFLNGKFFKWDNYYAEHYFNFICNGMQKKGQQTPNGYSFEWRKDLYYYQGDKLKPYMLIMFPSVSSMENCEKYLAYRREFFIGRQRIGWVEAKVWETDIPPVRKLLTYRNCKFSGWLRFEGIHPKQKGTLYDSDEEDEGVRIKYDKMGQIVYVEDDVTESFEQISKFPIEREWVISCDSVSMTPEDDEVISKSTHPKLMAYDIEVYSDNVRKFPDMWTREHCVFMISCVYQVSGDPSSRKYYALVYGDSNIIPKEKWEALKDAEIIHFNDELSLIEKFASLVMEYDVDVLTGYNIYDFDNTYMDARLKLSMKKYWPEMGRLINVNTELHSSTWESGGYGFNSINYLKIPGRISVDMLPVIRREHKLMKYNLDTVAEHFLKRGKHDVTPAEMFLSFEKNQKAIKEWSDLISSLFIEKEDAKEFYDKCKIVLDHLNTELTTATDYLTSKISSDKWKEARRKENEEIRKCIYSRSFRIPSLTPEMLSKLSDEMKKTKEDLEQRKIAWRIEFESGYDKEELEEIKIIYNTQKVREELVMHDDLNDPANSPMYNRNGELNWCGNETWEYLVSLAIDAIESSGLKLPNKVDLEKIAKLGVAKFLMTRIIVYCLFDSDLCIELFEKLNVWVGLIEMSSVVGVTPVDLFTRGQQIRCLSQLYDMAAKRGIILSKRMSPDIFFNGGFVFDVIPGIYEGVMVQDFSSLYPSIIIAYNICYTTLLHPRHYNKLNEKDVATIIVPRPDVKSDDGAEYDLIDDKGEEMEEDKNLQEDEEDLIKKERTKEITKSLSDVVSDEKNYYFQYIQCNVDGKFDKSKEGLLPAILSILISERTAVRELQKKYNKSDLMWMILEKRQLALKISANSMFGFLGAGKMGKRSLIEAAMSITATGRLLITSVNKEVEEKYGCRVVYGDTDSSMFSKIGVDPSEYNKLGKRLGEEMSKGFKEPLKLEFEKTMRMIALARKKYAGYVYDDDGKFIIDKDTGLPYLYLRGNVLARRDNTKWLRETYEKLMRMALEYKSIDDAINYLIESVEKFMTQEIDHNNLVTVRSINSHYKNNTYFMKLFADRLTKMGTPVRPGERIGYLVVKPRNEFEASYIGNRMVTPEMYLASKHDKDPYVIDRLYYLQKQFMNSLDQLFAAGYKDKIGKYEIIKYKKITARKWIGIETPVQMMVKIMENGLSLDKFKESIKAVRRNDKRGPILSERWEKNGFSYPEVNEPNVDVSKLKFAMKMRKEMLLKEAKKKIKSPSLNLNLIENKGLKIATQFN